MGLKNCQKLNRPNGTFFIRSKISCPLIKILINFRIQIIMAHLLYLISANSSLGFIKHFCFSLCFTTINHQQKKFCGFLSHNSRIFHVSLYLVVQGEPSEKCGEINFSLDYDFNTQTLRLKLIQVHPAHCKNF